MKAYEVMVQYRATVIYLVRAKSREEAAGKAKQKLEDRRGIDPDDITCCKIEEPEAAPA